MTDTFLTLEELLLVFPVLKQHEMSLNSRQRQVLVTIERILYDRLSINEIEHYLEGAGEYV